MSARPHLRLNPRPSGGPDDPAQDRRRAGFSLIELFVAMGAMLLVIGFVLATFTAQHQTYTVVDQVSETQQNTRAIATLVERDVRNAGYMVPPESAACGVDQTNGADTLFVSDSDAIEPVDALPMGLRGAELSAELTSGPPTSTGSDTNLTVDDVVIDANPSYDTDGDTVDDSDFRSGGGAILVDLANPGRGAACGLVTAVAPPTGVTVNFFNLLGAGLLPPDYRLVPATSYQLTTPVGGGPSRLERNGVILAKDVEDLQLAWFFDANANGEVDANEYVGGLATAYDNTLVDGNDLRELRFTMVVRTSADDPRNPTAASIGQTIENRTANIPPADGRRRRIHSSTVRVRNVAS